MIIHFFNGELIYCQYDNGLVYGMNLRYNCGKCTDIIKKRKTDELEYV